MKEVPQNIYEVNIENIFHWFKNNVHVIPHEKYTYKVVPLESDYHRMCDIINDDTNGIHFRVIIKATYEDVTKIETPVKNFRDLALFFQTKSNPPITHTSATQVCFIQLDQTGNPKHAALVTYSAQTGENYLFPVS